VVVDSSNFGIVGIELINDDVTALLADIRQHDERLIRPKRSVWGVADANHSGSEGDESYFPPLSSQFNLGCALVYANEIAEGLPPGFR